MSKTAKLGTAEATEALQAVKAVAIQAEVISRSDLHQAISRNFADVITDAMVAAYNLGNHGQILIRRLPAFYKGQVDNLYRNHYYSTTRWTSYMEQAKNMQNMHEGMKAEFRNKKGEFDAPGYRNRLLNATVDVGGQQTPFDVAAITALRLEEFSAEYLQAMIDGLEEGMNNFFAWADEKNSAGKTGRERNDTFQKKFKYQPPEQLGSTNNQVIDANAKVAAVEDLFASRKK